MPSGDELAKDSKKRDEERRKKIADKAADKLGGLSGQGVSTIRERNARMKKLLDNL